MLVLPTQLAFLKGDEGTLGRIDKINTENPEFIVQTNEGTLTFCGRFVEPESTYLGIDLAPKRMQSICTDVISRLLVFDKPAFISGGASATSSPQGVLSRGASIRSTGTAENSQNTPGTLWTSSQQSEGAEEVLAEESIKTDSNSTNVLWELFHGCSVLASASDKSDAFSSSLRRGSSGTINDADFSEEDDDELLSGSEFGDDDRPVKSTAYDKKKRKIVERSDSGAKSTKRAKVTKNSKIQPDIDKDENSLDLNENLEAIPRERPSKARAVTKKLVNYFDDVPSDDGIDDDDLVQDKKKDAASSAKKPVQSSAYKKNSFQKELIPEDVKSAKNSNQKVKQTKASAAKAASKKNSGKAKKSKNDESDEGDQPSSDSDFMEILDDFPVSSSKQNSKPEIGSRPQRSVAKKPKSYAVDIGSSDEIESEDD